MGDVKQFLTGSESSQDKVSGNGKPEIDVVKVDSVTSKDNKSVAVIERLSVGSKSTTWVQFVEGPFKDFIRFERSEIGQ